MTEHWNFTEELGISFAWELVLDIWLIVIFFELVNRSLIGIITGCLIFYFQDIVLLQCYIWILFVAQYVILYIFENYLVANFWYIARILLISCNIMVQNCFACFIILR